MAATNKLADMQIKHNQARGRTKVTYSYDALIGAPKTSCPARLFVQRIKLIPRLVVLIGIKFLEFGRQIVYIIY